MEIKPGLTNKDQNLKVNAAKYLTDLREKLESASKYASAQCEAEQHRYVRTYNKRTRDKKFDIGEHCLILHNDDTSSSPCLQNGKS